MLDVTTRIYVRDPQRDDNLIPGVVSETLGKKVIVRFLQPVSFLPGVETVMLFHDHNNCFTSVPCQLQRMYSAGQYPTGAMVLTGSSEVAENRSAYRVNVHDKAISAIINDEDQGEVINISCGGVAAVLFTESYKEEQWLKIALMFDCEEHFGKVQVRSKTKLDDGRFRYGLMADPSEVNLVSQLSRITQALQNVKARRASRIGVNNKHNGEASNSQYDSQGDSNNQTDQDNDQEQTPVSEDGTQRMHARNPWPGMAKVYIREEHNLRVLDVDTADLSRGGISFLSPQYIYEGSEVLFEKPVSGGFFRVMIAIRNVMVQQKGKHRIGAQFLGAPLAPGKMPDEFSDIVKAA